MAGYFKIIPPQKMWQPLCHLFFMLIFCSGVNGQQRSAIKNPAIGIHYISNDFKSADYVRKHSLSEAFRNKEFARSANMKSGLAVSYLQGIAPHLDISVTLAGSYLDYILHDGTSLGSGHLLMETEACLSGKLFTDSRLVTPYLSAGLSASKYNDYYGLLIPIGGGVQMNFSGKVYILMTAQYRTGMTNKVNDHFYYSLGIAGNVFGQKRRAPSLLKTVPISEPASDRDKDGIADSVDACPDVPGLIQFCGCPDRDGDGIPDMNDSCPDAPGLVKYRGCPVPDTDGDGINDELDSCVNIPGVIEYHGCPVPDTDKDGVNDNEDKCPLLPGPVSNFGCPVVNDTIRKAVDLAAQKIFFKTGSYGLLSQSFKSLNNIAAVLKANPSLQLRIEGHTDNVGATQKNQLLSENRANAVMEYLVQKNGINAERLTAVGFGSQKPIASNNTTDGRAINRRVEFILFY